MQKVIIIILVVVVAGLITWLVIDSLQNDSDTQQPTTKTPYQTASDDCSKNWLCAFMAVTSGIGGITSGISLFGK